MTICVITSDVQRTYKDRIVPETSLLVSPNADVIYYDRTLVKTNLVAQMVKNLSAVQVIQVPPLDWEDPPGEGKGNPLQYSCLENSRNRGAWQRSPWGPKSQTGLSD